MKKTYTAILALFCVFSISAQDSYYYYNGEKRQLVMDNTKIVSISYASSDNSLSAMQGYVLIDVMKDDSIKVELYELNSITTLSDAIENNPLPETVSLQPCFKNAINKQVIPDGYIDIKLKKINDYVLLDSLSHHLPFEIVSQDAFMPLWYTIRMIPGKGRNSVNLANRIEESNLFACSSPSFIQEIEDISYDPLVHEQWALRNSIYPGIDLSVSEAWNYSTGQNIVIAIVEGGGVDRDHIDLKDNIFERNSYGISHFGRDPYRCDNHATLCAGIAAAVRNNGTQIAGVAPDAKIMSSCLSIGPGENNGVAYAINWAWKNGADIISCSWSVEPSTRIDNAIDSAATKGRDGKGCVIVTSAGNTGREVTYPGNYSDDVLAISNIDKHGDLVPSSSRGNDIFVGAPGMDILSTSKNNGTSYCEGTSMSCPYVSGVAALVLERNPELTAVQVREIIARSARKIGVYQYTEDRLYGKWNKYFGYGLVNALNAVKNTPRKNF